MLSVRMATPADASAVAAVYAPFVRDTAISFEVEPPDAAEMAQRIGTTLPTRPWLVAETVNGVVGYAYAAPHRARTAYQWSVEPSVYIAADAQGQGIGRKLYTALLAILRAQGFANAYAGVTLPNERSLRLHRTFGFEEVGVYRRVGYKHGRWHDVWWAALDLLPDRGHSPTPPRPIDELQASDELLKIFHD